MSITSTFMRSVLVASLLATGAVLGGCEGDDGLDGAQGPPGEPGEPGAPGPEGPPGVGTTKPLESCGVCHESGSVIDAATVHAVTGLSTVSDVAFTVAGADLVVTYNLKVDGIDTTDFTEIQSDYRTQGDGTRFEPLPDGATATSTGSGNYSITIPGGAAAAGTNSRYMFRVRNEAGVRAVVVGDFPAAPWTDAVSSETCNNCHGETGIYIHGGGYSIPAGMEQCTVCHKSTAYDGTDREYKYPWFGIVHGVHVAHAQYPEDDFEDDPDNAVWNGEYVRPSGHFEYDERHIYETTYPTYMANCNVCHEGFLDAVNEMPVTGAGCFSCHESMESWEPLFTKFNLTFHLGYDEETNCSVCHNDADNVAPATVAEMHNGIVTERGGIIWDGVDTSVEEGAKFTWTITGVVDDGTNLAIDWEATYDGAPVDPCNADPSLGPVFDGDDAGNLSILYTYFQGGDPILGTVTSSNNTIPGQAESVNTSTTNTVCAGTVATTTITPTRPLVEGVTMGRIAIQGKPRVVSIADPTATMAVRAKTPTYDFMVGSGDKADARRMIVDTTNKCLKCHVGSLYQHGGNRVDNVDMCILCHNSASNEQNVRVGMGVEPSEAYEGKAGQTFEMKSMLHAIHSAGDVGRGGVNMAPIVIYRNRGIYAWAEDRDMLSNWPGEGSQIVYGSNDVTQNHNFHSPTYPRLENDCGACHVEGFKALFPDAGVAMASTLAATEEPGEDTVWSNQLDDVLQGAGASSCTTCHSDGAAKGHAYQNGWTPQAFEEGRQTIIDAAN